MPITLELYQLKNLLIEAAEYGSKRALKEVGLYRDEISQREAYREYGQANVNTWENLGLIRGVKMNDKPNSKKLYSRVELDKIKIKFNQ